MAPELVLYLNPINGDDAAIVMATFQGVARRVVAISSQDVYRAYGRVWGSEPGPPDAVPLAEDAPLRERPSPDRERFAGTRIEKIDAERVALGDPELPGTVLRWPMVYGPRDGAHRLWGPLRRMDAGRPAILLEEGLAHWRWSRGYSENVAHAVVLAALDDRAAGRVYNVAEQEAFSEAGWVAQLRRVTGWEGAVVVLPRERTPAHLLPKIDTGQPWFVDTTRIREELGYAEPVPREEALRRTIVWERANPPTGERAAEPDYAAEDTALAGITRSGL